MRALLTQIWTARRALALYATLILAGMFAGEHLMGIASPDIRPMNEPLIHRMVMSALFVFILTAAIPFVPGAEIGLALLVMFGAKAAPLVYLGMVGALILSFMVARLVPLHILCNLTRKLHLSKTAAWLERLATTPRHERAQLLSGQVDKRFSKALLRNRYVLLALLLNMPGNSFLGGGGGLAFAAGISGLYRFGPYVLCVLIAVSPIPLAFIILGM